MLQRAPKLLTALAFLLGSTTVLLAREKLTYAQGVKICQDWCTAHRQGVEADKCKFNCISYWGKNGSDMAVRR